MFITEDDITDYVKALGGVLVTRTHINLNANNELNVVPVCLTGYNYSLDPSMEGYMVMFPSETQHCVYPFYTSDEERISISGNLT